MVTTLRTRGPGAGSWSCSRRTSEAKRAARSRQQAGLSELHSLPVQIAIEPEGAAHSVHCRDLGAGQSPLLHLHGGWGHDVYPFDRPLAALGPRFRVLIPDRVGYGSSSRRSGPLPLDFHRRAAAETLALMDALSVESAVLWGHSDGACTAVWMGLDAPARCRAIVLEALHFDRAKPGSREFFHTMATHPRACAPRVRSVLAAEHGESYWEDLVRREGTVWRAIQETPHPHPDLFDGRLGEITVPVLVLHGDRDPRTEPGELEAIRRALPQATVCVIEGGGHCPHSEPEVATRATRAVVEFFERHGLHAG
jgi:pimeloyl-ACP methyl ester carboxylesterase